MLKFVLIAFFLIGSIVGSPRSEAGYMIGRDLADRCQNKSAYCIGFLIAVSDTDDLMVTWNNIPSVHCRPDDVGSSQLYAVVIKYLGDHPEKLHLGAAGLVLTAMSEAWPCRN